MDKRKRLTYLAILACIFYILIYWKSSPTKVVLTTNDQINEKVLVIYAYIEKNSHHIESLRFFRDLGITEDENIDYLIIVQGFNSSVTLPNFKNIRVFKRPNDCYDFGAFGEAIRFIGGTSELKKYKLVIFINSSVFGPFLPKYWPKSMHWTKIFSSQLQGNVQVTGTVINCLPKEDQDGRGPRVSGMAFAALTDFVLKAYDANVFDCFKDKVDVILKGEYGISKLAIKLGVNLDTLLLQYGDVNWLDSNNWDCNGNQSPFFKSKYGNNMDIHPLETVFYKPLWMWGDRVLSESYLNEVYTYMKWARKRAGIT